MEVLDRSQKRELASPCFHTICCFSITLRLRCYSKHCWTSDIVLTGISCTMMAFLWGLLSIKVFAFSPFPWVSAPSDLPHSLTRYWHPSLSPDHLPSPQLSCLSMWLYSRPYHPTVWHHPAFRVPSKTPSKYHQGNLNCCLIFHSRRNPLNHKHMNFP